MSIGTIRLKESMHMESERYEKGDEVGRGENGTDKKHRRRGKREKGTEETHTRADTLKENEREIYIEAEGE